MAKFTHPNSYRVLANSHLARLLSTVLNCRWVYRNPSSILDPAAVDYGKGSKNGTVNSFTSALDKNYQPRLRYNHMATLAHLPNGSIIAQWQVRLLSWQALQFLGVASRFAVPCNLSYLCILMHVDHFALGRLRGSGLRELQIRRFITPSRMITG